MSSTIHFSFLLLLVELSVFFLVYTIFTIAYSHVLRLTSLSQCVRVELM